MQIKQAKHSRQSTAGKAQRAEHSMQRPDCTAQHAKPSMQSMLRCVLYTVCLLAQLCTICTAQHVRSPSGRLWFAVISMALYIHQHTADLS